MVYFRFVFRKENKEGNVFTHTEIYQIFRSKKKEG